MTNLKHFSEHSQPNSSWIRLKTQSTCAVIFTLALIPSAFGQGNIAEKIRRGNDLIRDGDFAAALAQYETIETQGESADILALNKGIAARNTEDNESACAYFQRAAGSANYEIAARAKFALGNFSIANAIEQKDKKAAMAEIDSAIQFYRDALRADRSFFNARHNLEIALALKKAQQQDQEQQDQKQQDQDQQNQDQQNQDQQNQDQQDQDQQDQDQQDQDQQDQDQQDQDQQDQDQQDQDQQDQEQQDQEQNGSSAETSETAESNNEEQGEGTEKGLPEQKPVDENESDKEQNDSSADPKEMDSAEQDSSKEPQSDDSQGSSLNDDTEESDRNRQRQTSESENKNDSTDLQQSGTNQDPADSPKEEASATVNQQQMAGEISQDATNDADESESVSPPDKIRTEKYLTKDEANKFLQMIRDRDFQRRQMLKRARERRRRPVQKDW